MNSGEVLEPKLTGDKIGEVILTAMDELGLDAEFCVEQGYDGAAVMKSDIRGTAAKRKPTAQEPTTSTAALTV